MQPSSKEVVLDIVKRDQPATLLDLPCGKGWLGEAVGDTVEIDGIDLFTSPLKNYRSFFEADLDHGVPEELPEYDCVACCEGIEHFANPGLFFESVLKHLEPGGMLIVTTPNTWYPGSRIQFSFRGFFPGFPCLAGRIKRGSHMHIMPWSWPHLYLYLTLFGFEDVRLHREPLSKPRHGWERLFAVPQQLYCKSRLKKAKQDEEKRFWEIAASEGSVCGRHLIVSGRKPR